MGEFKAQILGVILVLGVFAALNGAFTEAFTDAWDQVALQVAEQITPTP